MHPADSETTAEMHEAAFVNPASHPPNLRPPRGPSRLAARQAGANRAESAMRIMALDPGTVRVGVAVSDELRMIATPLEFIPAEPWPAFLTRLQALLAEREVGEIIVGMPRNMDGSHGPAAEQARQFVAALREALTVPIRTWDERLTTKLASRMMSQAGRKARDQKGRVDASAAAVLLQGFLDANP